MIKNKELYSFEGQATTYRGRDIKFSPTNQEKRFPPLMRTKKQISIKCVRKRVVINI